MSDRRRRKSLSIFRPSLSTLTPIHDAVPESAPPSALKKKLRVSKFFQPSSPTSPASPDLERANSRSSIGRPSSPVPLSRPRTLQKTSRPSSIFGSFRSLHSLADEDESLPVTRTRSNPMSLSDDGSPYIDIANMVVLHHGEVQTSGGMFRKRSQYLVLTNTHLLRFKGQGKASEAFPSIPASLGRSSTTRHSRISSSGSLHELQVSAENHVGIQLNQVAAVYKLDDGRPYFTIEIAHLDETSSQPSTTSLQLSDPRESDLWLTSIRAAITKSRLIDPLLFSPTTIEYVARAVESECDYDPNHFRIFKVVQRATKSGGRSSSDDLAKLTSSIYYLVIGIHKAHLIPLPKPGKSLSSTSLSDITGASYGILSLVSICMQTFDDAFKMAFRIPLQQPTTLHLASSSVTDIALSLRQAAEYLRPIWLENPFDWNVPKSLDDALLPVPPPELEDHYAFDRTLTAYCVAYGVDPSNVRYTVNYASDDSPEFELLEPSSPRRTKYTVLELLAIMRSLRYNESFHAITFGNVKLDSLHGLCDRFGSEHMLWTTRCGDPLRLPQQEKSWLIIQEIQSLALKSKRLRRLDFSNCLTRKPTDEHKVRDSGTGICQALFPLCAKQLTNVDWIILNGIKLAEIDVDYLYAAVIDRLCHFRALDLGCCGLIDNSLSTVLQGILHQEETLESLDISGNAARLDAEQFGKQLRRFQRIRKLNLSNTQFCAGPLPILASDNLLRWKLEELSLVGTSLNEQSVSSLATYLDSPQSNTLRTIRLNQSQLTGKDVGSLLQSMCKGRYQPRLAHLHISENRLERKHKLLVDAIASSATPTHMTMQMLEYDDELDFQAFVSALAHNKTLRYLDISRISLPVDAGEETCKRLRFMLETNNTLEELDISGEQAHLEAVTLGDGLSGALRGLEVNQSLTVLRVEHQVLGLDGLKTLASVLEKNSTLREIHCESNEVSLEAFTILVNALRKNTSLLYFPNMDRDRVWSRQKLDREVGNLRESSSLSALPTKATVRKALGGALTGTRSASGRIIDRAILSQTYTEKDVRAALESLDVLWDSQVVRLQGYLRRNYRLAHGLPDPREETLNTPDVDESNTNTDSLALALKEASLNRTPTLEVNLQLGHGVNDEESQSLIGNGGGRDFGDSRSERDYDRMFDYKENEEEVEGALMMAQEVHA